MEITRLRIFTLFSVFHLLRFCYSCGHHQVTGQNIEGKVLLKTKIVTPVHFNNDTLANHIVIYEDSSYSLSYLKEIPDPDNKYGGSIVTSYDTGKSRIHRDTIFLNQDTLLLNNGYIHFMENGRISHLRQIEYSAIPFHSNYTISKYPKYHIINHNTPTIEDLIKDKKFKKLLTINDSLMDIIEGLVQDTVDRMMPKTIIFDSKMKPLVAHDGSPCCYYHSYYKKVLPYIDNKEHQQVILFLALKPHSILEGDIPIVFDGGYNFLDIYLNLTKRNITHIGTYGYL